MAISGVATYYFAGYETRKTEIKTRGASFTDRMGEAAATDRNGQQTGQIRE